MLSTPIKVILFLVAIAAVKVALVSGLKCYKCYEQDPDTKYCRIAKATAEKTSDGLEVLLCSVQLVYRNLDKPPTIEVYREIANMGDFEMAGPGKEGGKVMDSCDDFKKFPQPVKEEDGTYSYQTCYCAKDMCNSAIIPKP